MADATILMGGHLKRTTKIEVIGFNYKSGFLIKFKYNNKVYIHVNKQRFKDKDQNSDFVTVGYYVESEFLKYLVQRSYTSYELSQHLFPINALEDGKIDDKIKIKKLDTGMNVPFCTIVNISWDYTGGPVVDIDNVKDQHIIIPASSNKVSDNLTVHPFAKIFYNVQKEALLNNISVPTDKREIAINYITLIALQIHNIYTNIFKLFENEITFKGYIDAQTAEWNSPNIFANATTTVLLNYYYQITNFYNAAYSNQLLIAGAHSETKLYWLAYALSKEALSILPASEKIEILKLIAKGSIVQSSKIAEISTSLGTLGMLSARIINEEAFVIKIVESVSISDPLQYDDFLNRLISNINYDSSSSKKNITLFETLYSKVNDFGGEENLGTLINELYKIWLLSSYFPYNADGSVKDSVASPSHYVNKAVAINYEADKYLWIFNDTNYDFNFNGEKINVIEDVFTKTAQATYSNSKLIGGYGIYQTITIKNTNANTASINFISVKSNGQDIVALPIFYLKYIDDKKNVENIITGVQLTVDVVLTFSGIGNLSKLKHIRTVYKLGRAALGLEEVVAGDVLATYEFAQGVVGVVEIGSSLGNLFIQYSKKKEEFCDIHSSEYDKAKCEFYTKLDNIFIVLQLFSGVLDLATSKLISGSSRKLLEGPIPNDFNPDALAILRRFAGDIEELKEVFRVRLINEVGENSIIWQRIERAGSPGEFTIAKRDEFILDFERANKDVIKALNEDDSLIDIWKDVEDLDNFAALRRDINFLKDLKFIQRSNTELNSEIFIGFTEGRLKSEFKHLPPPHPDNHYIWTRKGVHHKDALEITGKNGLGRIAKDQNGNEIKKYFDPPHDTYYKAKIEILNKDYGNGAGKWFVKPTDKGYSSTFFPDWTKQKLQQELALAWGNKKYLKYSQYGGKMSDGVTVRFYLRNDIITSAHPDLQL